MNTPIYDVDYFINKFSAIPEDRWCTGTRSNGKQRCALGWCYPSHQEALKSMSSFYIDSEEDVALSSIIKILNPKYGVGSINNGLAPEYQQSTPKQRILAALHDIKKLQDPKVKEVIRYVSVSESLKKQTKELIEI